MSERNPDLQTRSEEIDQGSKDNSDDGCHGVPDSDTSTSKEIDGSPKDIKNVPSEAEEGGDEAKDKENRERMGNPLNPLNTTRNWTN